MILYTLYVSIQNINTSRMSSPPDDIKTILENNFNDRMKSIGECVSSFNEKIKLLKKNKELQSSYTNQSVYKRHREMNGESAPPLLMRQYNIQADKAYTDSMEAENNIRSERDKLISNLCNFTEDEIKYIIETHPILLSYRGRYSFPILCDIDGVTHSLKHVGKTLDDVNGFFLTRFIIEDNIVPVFNTNLSFVDETRKGVFLKIDKIDL